MAINAEVSSVTLSLHQRLLVSIGGIEEELSYQSIYVHEKKSPVATPEGVYRDENVAGTVCQGRHAFLIEWMCPPKDILPIRPTVYTKTQEGNLECGLSLRVEVDMVNGGTKLMSIIHGIQYVPTWTDARSDQTIPLRAERSIGRDKENMRPGLARSSASIRSYTSRDESPLINQQYTMGRHGSFGGADTLQYPYTRKQPGPGMLEQPYLPSPRELQVRTPVSPRLGNAEYFSASDANNGRVSHGSYGGSTVSLHAPSIHAPSRAESQRTIKVTERERPHEPFEEFPVAPTTPTIRRHGHERQVSLGLPPPSIRSSLSSTFSNWDVNGNATTPPPKVPLPAAPVSVIDMAPVSFSADGLPVYQQQAHSPTHVKRKSGGARQNSRKVGVPILGSFPQPGPLPKGNSPTHSPSLIQTQSPSSTPMQPPTQSPELKQINRESRDSGYSDSMRGVNSNYNPKAAIAEERDDSEAYDPLGISEYTTGIHLN